MPVHLVRQAKRINRPIATRKAEPLPAISVIMPVYNRADTVGRAVGSVLGQSFADFELIVVDDGSTDRTAQALRNIRDPRLRLIELERNVGGNAARNHGIREARSPLITFLDSDDEYLPHRLDSTVRYFAEHPDADLLVDTCIKRWPNAPGKLDLVRQNPELSGNELVLAALFDRRLFKATPGITVRREVAVKAGLFDEGLRRRQDYDFILRVAKVGKLASRNEANWVKTNSMDAITADTDRSLEAIYALWDRHPEHFAKLNPRTGMADDLARHFTKLAARGQGRLLLRDIVNVVARFGAGPVAAMLLRGFGSYSARKARQLLFGKRRDPSKS
jgi:GT2 family glycosyltransferase